MVLSVGVGALGSAAAVVSRIGSAIDRAHTAAAPVTTTVAAAAGDEVSVAIAALFGGFGRDFHTRGAQGLVFHG